jgi:hypothetical protein
MVFNESGGVGVVWGVDGGELIYGPKNGKKRGPTKL